jgi:hypothetical protein
MKQIFILSSVLILALYSFTDIKQKDNLIFDNISNLVSSSTENSVKYSKYLSLDSTIKKELVIIQKVEDGPYPYFFTSLYFIKKDTAVNLSLDIEEIAFYEGLHSLVNDTVMVSYRDVMEYKIKKWNKPLNEDERKDINPEWKELTGKLKGADFLNIGDSYDQLFIENEEVPDFSFNYYTYSSMIKNNNMLVTVYYTSKKTIEVTAISLLK